MLDLFSGVGGLALGFAHAAEDSGRGFESTGAVDNDAIDDWRTQGPHWASSQSLHLTAGPHPITVEYFEATGDAQMHRYWKWTACPIPIAQRIVPA